MDDRSDAANLPVFSTDSGRFVCWQTGMSMNSSTASLLCRKSALARHARANARNGAWALYLGDHGTHLQASIE